MADPIVNVEDVWVHYHEVPALRAVSLSIAEGEFLGLIGPNGGGKTTLMRVILGLVKPDRGKVEVFGMAPDRMGARRHLIGYIPQRAHGEFNFPVSVLDVVLMGRYGRIGLVRRPSSGDLAVARRCLELVEMDAAAGRQFSHLSGGQQQRVLIARALCTEPRLLMLDEPSAGVDPCAEEKFYDLLKVLKQSQLLTVVVVTHDISVVSTHVEKLACLNQVLYMHGSPSEVVAAGTLEQVYGCHIELLAHGKVPHRVLEEHP